VDDCGAAMEYNEEWKEEDREIRGNDSMLNADVIFASSNETIKKVTGTMGKRWENIILLESFRKFDFL